MKGIMKLFPAALAVVALASCADFDEQTSSKQFAKADGSKIYATIGEAGAATRVAMARNDEGKRGLVFVEGDAINVYNLDASTKFYGYKLESGANSDQAVFAFDAASSSSGITAAPDMTSGEFYAVTKSLGAKIYSLSPGTAGPELSIEIPAKFKKEDVDASWGAGLTGKGYSMPLPLWGKVATDGDLMGVNFKYLTGFLGINLTTLRAGTKFIDIEADKPISGYFQATLDVADPTQSVLTPHEALTSNNKITIEINPADYEGASDFFYVPLIAQTYNSLKITAYKAAPGDIADGVLFEMAAGKSFTLAQGKGISLNTGMTVMTDATTGADLSSKIYELTQKLPGKSFTIGLLNDLSTTETIYIDKNATSTINIQMASGKAITGNITFVEGSVTDWDQSTLKATWSTEATNENSESAAAKKHTVNLIYDNTIVTNTGNINFYLPAAAVSVSSEGDGTYGLRGNVTALTAEDGGFTVEEGAQIASPSSNVLTNLKDGPIVIDGFVNDLKQYGNGNVVINNLNQEMQSIVMGKSTAPVAGTLTINGLATSTIHVETTTSATANSAKVRTISSYSTGAFTANKIDVTSATTDCWNFYETVEDGAINFINDGNFITSLNTVNVYKKNNVNLTNTIINTYNYEGKKKCNVTATGKSAIVSVTNDNDDMLTITSTWDGSKSDDVANVYNKVRGAVAIANVVGSQIHTAFQLASVQNVGADLTATMKSTTVIDLNGDNKQWRPIAVDKAITINGTADEEAVPTIRNIKYTPTGTGTPVVDGGLFSNRGGKATTLSNIQFENVTVNNSKFAAALIPEATGDIQLTNVTVTGAEIVSAAKDNISVAGGLVGTAKKITATGVFVAGTKVEAVSAATSVAGGMVGINTSDFEATTVGVALTTDVKANIAGGLVGQTNGGALTLSSTSLTNEIAPTKVISLKADGAAGGLVGEAKAATTVYNTNVTAAIEGLFNLGGMVGLQTSGNSTFGNSTKATATSVNATFALSAALNIDDNKTEANKAKWGSVNTYIGNVVADKVLITKWCKHGAVAQTVEAKEALNYKLNVVTTTDGINTNYWYFFSGNAWVGTVAEGLDIQFPDNNNVAAAAALTNGTDYNVRKMSPQYLSETYSDWDE